jgi:hypothetical protein
MAKKRKRRKKRVVRKKRKKRRAKAVRRVSGPAGLVRQLNAHRQALVKQQAALQDEIDSISAAIDALGGARRRAPVRARRGVRRGGRRAVRKGSLKSYVLRVLQSRGEMAVKDIAKAVKRAGYRTGSKNFPNQVSNALAQMDELTKTGRGRYKL